MKHFFLIQFFLITILSTGIAQTIIKSPAYGMATSHEAKIVKIEFAKEFTGFHCSFITPANYLTGGWASVLKTIYLRDVNTEKRFHLLKAKNIPYYPEKHKFTGPNQRLDFILYFAPVDSTTFVVDMIENIEGGFNFFKIILIDQHAGVILDETYKPGYHINQNKDTVYGQIKHVYRDEDESNTGIIFKSNTTGEKKRLEPRNVIGFSRNNRYFYSMKKDGHSIFVKQKAVGDLNLVSYHNIEMKKDMEYKAYGMHYLLFRKGSNDYLEMNKYNYSAIIRDLFQGNKRIEKKLEATKYMTKDASKIIDLYNEDKENQVQHFNIFNSGYLIKNQGDTLFGEVGYMELNNGMQVCLKDEKGNRTVYFSHELYGFYESNLGFFFSKEIDEIPKFAKLEAGGKYLNLYIIRSKSYKNGYSYFFELPEKKQTWIVKQNGFKVKMKTIFYQHKEIMKKLNKNELTYSNVADLVELYNSIRKKKK